MIFGSAAKDPSLDSAQVLVILDQVEDVFVSPTHEGRWNTLFDCVARLINEIPNVRLVLSFRKEYLAEVKDALRDRSVRFRWYSLRALTESGLRRAVNGVWEDREIARHFAASCCVERELENALIDRVTRDEEGNAAPLLQYQLRTLWDRSLAARSGAGSLTYDF